MKKFAYLVHLPGNYRTSLSYIAKPLGLVPNFVYKGVMYSMPFNPFIYSEIRLHDDQLQEPDGFVIMLPYTAAQLQSQQWRIQPLIDKAIKLAVAKGATLMGLGPTLASITMGGRLLQANPFMPVTNGCTYTAMAIAEKLEALLKKQSFKQIAIIGATGSVGQTLATLLAPSLQIPVTLVARNVRRLHNLANGMRQANPSAQINVTDQLKAVQQADLIINLADIAAKAINTNWFQEGSILLTTGQIAHFAKKRPDLQITQTGILNSRIVNFSRSIPSLAANTCWSSLAETILLAQDEPLEDYHLSQLQQTPLEMAKHLQMLETKAGLGFCAWSFPGNKEAKNNLEKNNIVPGYKLASS